MNQQNSYYKTLIEYSNMNGSVISTREIHLKDKKKARISAFEFIKKKEEEIFIENNANDLFATLEIYFVMSGREYLIYSESIGEDVNGKIDCSEALKQEFKEPAIISEEAKEIIQKVEDFTGINIHDISKKRKIIDPRMLAMFLIRKNTNIGPFEIGSIFGEINPWIVCYACNTVETQLKVNPDFKNQYQELVEMVQN